MSQPRKSLAAGEIQFYDSYEPGLKDGTYLIGVAQTLKGKDAPIKDVSITPVSQKFVVQGPRFALDPSEIHTVFPANGATGEFDRVLPHVVLNKRVIPWERDIPGLGLTVPWLALLVFSDGELIGDPGGGNFSKTLTVQELLAPDAQTRKPLLDSRTLTKDDLAHTCQAITCSSALLAQIVPTSSELPYLTHVRQVNTDEKVNFDLKDAGLFSVVVGNRFPQAGTPSAARKCIVHLVSLEGFGDLLAGASPKVAAQPNIQLVTLANWTFSCLADTSQTFGGLAKNLACDPAGLRPAASLMLRLPFKPATATDGDSAAVAVQQRLNDGYVALGYHASSGEDGFGWYRGPFSAVVSHAVPGAASFEAADAARIYDPSTGVFDLSLAAAWQAGRCLALASAPFATALTRVRLAVDATIEQLSAPTAHEVHANLAQIFTGGSIRAIRQASVEGGVARRPASASAVPQRTPIAALRAVLAKAEIQTQLANRMETDAIAQDVADWLGQLLLLRNVSFVHLVPDPRILPAESIRFFYLDVNWLDALIDGALSVGLATSRNSAVQALFAPKLRQMAQASALAWRANQIGQPPPPLPDGPTAGFLLRSALVSGWPGLSVSGTRAKAGVPLLRIERLAPNVLVALFNGVPDTVVLGEPQEGLEFGVDDDGNVETRILTALPNVTPGKPTPAPYRDGDQRVLNISSTPGSSDVPADLIGRLAQTLAVERSAIGPAYFAAQLVKGPGRLEFAINPS
jgi:hypothetical protein